VAQEGPDCHPTKIQGLLWLDHHCWYVSAREDLPASLTIAPLHAAMDDSYVYCKYHETALEQQAGRITLMHGVSVRLVKLEGTL
jgi:hypothetical protein